MNSIRHLDVALDGTVAFAIQWQGDPYEAPALLGLHLRGEPTTLIAAEVGAHTALQDDAGSVSFSGDYTMVAITSPRGGLIQVFAVSGGALLGSIVAPDACGLNHHSQSGFYYTDGAGVVGRLETGFGTTQMITHDRTFDIHLVRA